MSTGLSEVSGWWWTWMWAMTPQVLLLALVVLAFDVALRRWAWPGLLASAWMLVIVKLLLPPTISSPVSVSRLFESSSTGGSASTATSTAMGVWWLFLAWVGGVVLLAVLAIWRYRCLKAEVFNQDSRPIPQWLQQAVARFGKQLGLARIPKLRIQTNLRGPVVFGFFRPVVVLPAATVDSASRMQIEHALLHELAHIRRRDPLWSLLCLIVQIAYWFHPAVWLACRRLSMLRELGCDELVAQTLGHEKGSYFETLVHFSRETHSSTTGVLGFFPRQSQLVTRLSWLRRAGESSIRRRLICATATACLAFLGIPQGRADIAERTPPAAAEVVHESPETSFAAARPTDNRTPTVSEDLPPLDELHGSLRVRYAVMRMLANPKEPLTSNDFTTRPSGEQP